MLNTYKKIRFYLKWSLIFSFCLFSCTERADKNAALTIIWVNEKPTGIFIPRQIVSSFPEDSIEQLLHVHLAGNKTVMLGAYKINDDGFEFIPVIPFTQGSKYEVYCANKLIGELSVPFAAGDAPAVLTVYPSTDTLPENLLKFYIQFSRPMREGDALDHIRLIRNVRDTLSSVFLDLEPELWNNEGTMLTLWLDPGRIKRGLQPNELLGPPLRKGEHYHLLIEKNWQDARGVLLKQEYQKNFYTGVRDSISPDPNDWAIETPPAGAADELNIYFLEPLDYVLLRNTLRIADENAKNIKGIFRVKDSEMALGFIPDSKWQAGLYTLEIEPRLEDVSGNNLNHLFDADLYQKQPAPKSVFKRSFRVR
jgi:hypothetical protein